MKARRQVGARHIARARGAFLRRDVRPRQPGGTLGQPGAKRRDTGHTGATGAAGTSLAVALAKITENVTLEPTAVRLRGIQSL